MTTDIRELTAQELEVVSGGRAYLPNAINYPTMKEPGCVGEGDTIDTIPWGGKKGDGSWGTVDGNLPGH